METPVQLTRHPSRATRSVSAESKTSFQPYAAETFAEALNLYLAHGQAKNPRWSMRAWAKKIGLSQPGSLLNILKGRRLGTLETFEKITASMELDARASDYLRCLFEADSQKLNGLPERMDLRRRMKHLSSFGSAARLTPSDLNSVGSLLSQSVFALATTPDFSEDPAWILRRLRIPASEGEISGALRALVKIGLLKRDADRRLVPAKSFYEIEGNPNLEKIYALYSDGLELSRRSIRELPPARRFLAVETFSVRRDRYEEATECLRRFSQEFHALFSADASGDGEEVMQLNLQFVPLTRREEV